MSVSALVAIVGRPNVGKSTLFNRLVETRQAIMDAQPGVTRDRHYGQVEWNGQIFTAIDTGGYLEHEEDLWSSSIRSQVQEALREATLILFMVDCKAGPCAEDMHLAQILRETNKPILMVANKADTVDLGLVAPSFYALGIAGEVWAISAISGMGSGELLDAVVAGLPAAAPPTQEAPLPRIAIIGRPNAGKSSLVNALLGSERSIVSAQAGTTRDAVDAVYDAYGKRFVLVDTAGLYKRAKVQDQLMFYSVLRAIRAIQNSDVCVVLIDAMESLVTQDLHILQLAHRYKKGLLLVVNKWDLVEKDTQTVKVWKEQLEKKLGELSYVPIIFASVLRKQRIYEVVQQALRIYENKQRRIQTAALNECLLADIAKTPPPAVKGKYVKIKYITQVGSSAPIFAFFCNFPQYVKPHYTRFLMACLRRHFEFKGVPLTLSFRKK